MVAPNQFEVGKNKIVHKPTKAAFRFDTGDTSFKSVNWGRAGEQLSTGQDYRKDDLMRVAQQAISGHWRTIIRSSCPLWKARIAGIACS
jgi:hypothetical protein